MNIEKGVLRFTKNEKMMFVLRALGATALVGGSILLPTLPLILKPLFEKEKYGYSKREVERVIRKLEKEGLISIETGEKIVISEKGQNYLNFGRLEELTITKDGLWDKKWRLVVFDIPEEKRRERNYFRGFLKKEGFFMINKSVFVCPFTCEKEVREAMGILGLNEFVNLMRVDIIDNDLKLKKIFNLV